MTEFVKLVAGVSGTTSSGMRRLEMVAPVEQAYEALEALAAQLPSTFTFTAEPVSDINLKSEFVPSDAPAETEPGGVGIAARVDEHAEPTSPQTREETQ